MKIYKIYLIENKVNNKVYVGWTSQSIERRLYQHSKSSKVIGKAMRCYGIESFSIREIQSLDDRSAALQAEIYWVAFYKANHKDYGYNCTKGGDDSPIMRNHDVYKTEEFSEKMKNQALTQHTTPSKKKNHIDGLRRYWDNITDEERKERAEICRSNGKLGGTKKGHRKGIPNPKIKGKLNPHSKSYLVTKPDGTTEIIYCLREYCRMNSLTERNAQYVLAGKQSHHKGYIFTRLEDTLS